MPTLSAPAIEAVRARFPSLSNEFAFMDNAGGSQVPREVADEIRDYMLGSYAQIGADYPHSQRATATVNDAHTFIETLMGGDDSGRAILGSSTSTLMRMLADAYALILSPSDEIIVAESGHEANISPWLYLKERGFTVRTWEADPQTGVCSLATLRNLLSEKTKLVAFPHVSNILGGVEDVGPCVDAVHQAGAKAIVDGVAYAPHLPMSVAEWGVDWYVFSCYKVFGPHMAALWGTHEAMAELTGPNHSIVPRTEVPYKFELGGASHEGCAALLGLRPYLAFLAGTPTFGRESVVNGMLASEAMERPLTTRFLDFLATKPKVKVIGRADSREGRLPILAFTHETVGTKEIADTATAGGSYMRWGNFYSYRLLQRLGIDPTTGVARASFAHYNTLAEVDRLIASLDRLLD